MRRIETIATVKDDGTMLIAVPPDVPPGPHTVVVEIDEHPATSTPQDSTDWRTFLQETAGAWQGDFERPTQGTYEVREEF